MKVSSVSQSVSVSLKLFFVVDVLIVVIRK